MSQTHVETTHEAQASSTLLGRTALITGAGRGLGAELALALGRAGLRVVIVARNETDLARVVETARNEGSELHAFAANVADKRQAHAIAGAASAHVGPIDLLIHNASSLGHVPLRRLLDTDCEALEDTLSTNVIGAFRLSKIIAGAMVLRRHGTLVHISSDAAIEAYPSWGAYGLSKAALDHLSRTWAAELEGTGVRSLSIDPGEMDTQMHADAIPDADRSTLTSPREVATRIVRLLTDTSVKNGDRLIASSWSAS
ncbi:MAG: SDR family oxidoreductase [Polyangiaceae bacterium]